MLLLCLGSAAALAQAPGGIVPSASQVDGLSGGTAITFILIAAFAIGRIGTAIMFLLEFVRPAPEAGVDDAKEKLIYYGIVSALAVVVLLTIKLRVLGSMHILVGPYIDALFTGIVLVGGAGTIAELLKAPGADQQKEKPQPIEITGTLVLDESVKQKLTGHES
jgi:hypothetical protein